MDAKQFSMHKTLGKGSFGTVVEVTYENKPYAMKVFECVVDFAKELNNFNFTKGCKHVIQMELYSYIDPVILMELKHSYLVTKDQDIANVKLLMKNILIGVGEIHKRGLVHTDLKPRNILCDEGNINACVADLGSAVRMRESAEIYMTTRWYRAPEVCATLALQLKRLQVTAAIDIWSIGCIFAEFLNGGNVLFQGHSSSHMIMLMSLFDVSNFQCSDVHAKDLLSRMLTLKPECRISIDDALKHEFFRS